MPEPAELERQGRQLSRLETLMDVMFALMLFRVIAPLPMPQEESGWVWTFGALTDFFAEEGGAILMAVIGVILIVVYWLQNNKLLGNLVRTNGNHVSFCIGQLVFLMFYAYGMAIAEEFDSPSTRALQSLALAGAEYAVIPRLLEAGATDQLPDVGRPRAMWLFTPAHTQKHTHTYTHTYARAHTKSHTGAHTHTHARANIHTHAHTHTCTHIYPRNAPIPTYTGINRP